MDGEGFCRGVRAGRVNFTCRVRFFTWITPRTAADVFLAGVVGPVDGGARLTIRRDVYGTGKVKGTAIHDDVGRRDARIFS